MEIGEVIDDESGDDASGLVVAWCEIALASVRERSELHCSVRDVTSAE